MTRTRYYLVAEDLRRNPSDYEVLNEAEIYPLSEPDADGQRHPVRAGARRYTLAGRAAPTSYGLPDLLALPKVCVALKNKPLDIYGFHTRRVVSDRAKQLLCAIDADAFDFAACETTTKRREHVEQYWMMDIARVVEGFDEPRSVFETAKGVDGMTGEAYDGPHLSRLDDIHMSPDLNPGHHAFMFKKFRRHMVFDEIIVDAWRTQRLSGAQFLPLQPET